MAGHAITYLLQDASFYGGVKSAFEQATRLAARGHRVRVISLGPPPDWCSLDIPLTQVRAFNRKAVPESDFVVATFWTTVRAAVQTGRGIPVHYCRGYEGHQKHLPPILRDQIRLAYRLPAFKITNSKHDQAFLRDEFGVDAKFVPNAVDLAAFRRATPPPAPPWRILLVGPSQIPWKGIYTGLQAVSILKRRGHPVELVRVSQHPLSDAERAMGVVDQWLERVAPGDMPEIHGSVHIFLGTSVGEEEGFFLPAVEAMASGVPAVLTDIPCHRGYATGEAHALFVPAGEPVAMADAAERIMREPDLAHGLRETGVAVAARFDWDTHLDRLEAVLDEILAHHRTDRIAAARLSVPDLTQPLDIMLHAHRYQFATQFAKALCIVDVGCGSGFGTAMLADAGAKSVLGIDPSEIAITHARRDHARACARYETGEIQDLDLSAGTIDLVIALGAMDADDPRALLEIATRLLHVKGALLVAVRNPHASRNPTDDPGLRLEETATVDRLRAQLEGYFGRVVIFAQRIIGGELTLRAESIDPARDLAYVAMAVEPQRATFDIGERARQEAAREVVEALDEPVDQTEWRKAA